MIMINRYYTIFKTLETNSRGLKITLQRITRAKGYGEGENKNKYYSSWEQPVSMIYPPKWRL